MKKSLIAGAGATAFAFAALPFAGVFAAATPAGTITDTLNVNIPAGCTIVNGTDALPTDGSNPALTNSYTVEMQNGEVKTGIGGTSDQTSGTTAHNQISVTCNTGSGAGSEADWKLSVQGAGTAGHTTELYNADATDQIVAGTETSGSASNWAFQVSKAASAAYTQAYNEGNGGYMAVPSANTDIITGSGSVSNAFTITYQVYVDQTQDTGTYTGAVLYTLYNPAS